MVNLADHAVIVPILAPLTAGALMLLIPERLRMLKVTLGLGVLLALLTLALAQMAAGLQPGSEAIRVYRLGDWSAPYGIVLVADRLAGLMVGLTSALGLAALTFSTARWDRAGPRFHALFMFLITGVNGAILTGDLFNLFVFFEIMLAASYGLVLHGSGPDRLRAGLAYVSVNLTASFLFLIGVALIYGVTGTLNIADLVLAARTLEPDQRPLYHLGLAILGLAFLTKSAIWPVGLWLVPTYAAASAPAAAVLAILSKVGVYVLVRLTLLLTGDDAGASDGFGGPILLVGGLVTVVFATAGLLSSRSLTRAAGFSVIVSSGTVIAVLGSGDLSALSGALFYLVGSTLACAALFLVAEVLERQSDDQRAEPVFDDEYRDPFDDRERNTPGLVIPRAVSAIGGALVLCALMIGGLPPLAGFVGKLAMMAGLVARGGAADWLVVAVLTLSSLGAVIALTRLGAGKVWMRKDTEAPLMVGAAEAAGISGLLAGCVALAIFAGTALVYMDMTTGSLADRQAYVSTVMDRGP